MSYVKIDGYMLRRYIINGTNKLIANKERVDALNVFPVPDGDTGTNMSLTAIAAATEVSKLNSPNIGEVAKAAANGSLRGARGNSGVILSQIFRGFAKGLEGKDVADIDDVANAFACAMETAYKAVMKPKEGTILTIIRALAESAVEASYGTDDIDVMLSQIVPAGYKMLDKTQDMLPQLKQAGVVDAGGMGLMCIIEGGFANIGLDEDLNTDSGKSQDSAMSGEPKGLEDIDIKFGYCTEFFINIDNPGDKVISSLKKYLEKIGDSIVVVSDESIIKIHVHTNNPGEVLERALKVGSLENIKIENMRLQHTNRINFSKEQDNAVQEEKKEYGFVVVSTGNGFKDIFEKMGVDRVITGGQTMNPSTEDILSAINSVNAENIYVLPNNKNIILAAKQAGELCEDKNVIVLESKSIPQGLAAIINYIPTNEVEKNTDAMTEAMRYVSTGQITHAVRDTVIGDKEIKEGDYLCMLENDIAVVDKEIVIGCKALLDKMIEDNEDAGVISIYCGEEAVDDDTVAIETYIAEEYPDIEVEVYQGGQPIYYYIISVE